MTRGTAILSLIALSGCVSDHARCLLNSQQRVTVVELFFGRDIPGREPLTDREWSDFAASVISTMFPDGFTMTDGDGEWRNPATRAVTHERTKIVIAADAKSSDLASRVSRVRDAYSRMYRQASVGVLSYEACGQF
jgi:hypothetical protein